MLSRLLSRSAIIWTQIRRSVPCRLSAARTLRYFSAAGSVTEKKSANESKRNEDLSSTKSPAADFRFAMGERVRLLVTADPKSVEGVVTGRIQTLNNCDRYIVERPLKDGEMHDLVIDVSRLTTVDDPYNEVNIRDATRIISGSTSHFHHKSGRYQMLSAQAPNFKFERGQRVQIMITNQIGIIVSRIQHLTGCNRYNLTIVPAKDDKPKSVEMAVVSEHLMFGVDGENLMHLNATEKESKTPGGPIEFQKAFPSNL